MTRDEIQAEFDAFIEFPGKDKSYVTTVSTLLFAEHIARKARAQGLREAREVCLAERRLGLDDERAHYGELCAAAIKQLEGK